MRHPQRQGSAAQQRTQGCEKCSSLTFSEDWYTAFGVQLCNRCKKGEQLISKGRAKSMFLLTDKDLQGLGCLEKDNPQKKDWSAMKLYMRQQVEQVAFQRHGGPERLDSVRQQRLEKRLDERVKRRRDDERETAKEQAHLDRVKARIEQESARLLAEYAGEDGGLVPAEDVEVEEF